MEHLTKQQMILLALLVSFVTSIATGIITVSLMEQAPPAMTQTINRVVERTVERVVPDSNLASVVQKETIVVRADDMVVSAIEQNRKSMVKLREVYVVNGERKESVAGLGLVVGKDGLIAGDAGILVKNSENATAETYFAVFSGDKVLPISLVENNTATGLAYFKADEKERISAGIVYHPAVIGSPEGLKLGQAVVSIGGIDEDIISTGIISALSEKTVLPSSGGLEVKSDVPAGKIISLIKTDIFLSDLIPGSVLLNLSGEVVGFKAGSALYAKNNFLPSSAISTRLLPAKTE